MSNYLRHLLTKQLDITTNPEKPKKRFVPCFFHPILKKEKMRARKLTSNRTTLNACDDAMDAPR